MTKTQPTTKFNECFSCSSEQAIQPYFALNYYNNQTTSFEPVYLCNDFDCKNYLLNIIKEKDCPSHSQFSNIDSIS